MVEQAKEHVEGNFTESLVEESPDALIALSSDGTVLFWSRGAQTIFGYERQEVLGRTLDLLIVPAEGRHEARMRMSETLERGSSVFETARIRKDGRRIDVDVSMRRVNDSEGRARFIAVNKKDVTLLRKERGIETRFRGLLEAAPDAMVIVGRDGRIALVNGQTEKLFGYGRDELIGQPVEILVPERYRSGHPERRDGYLGDPMARPMGAGLDLYARRKDGVEFPAEISLSPMQSAEGTLVTAAIRDVTERKKAAEIEVRRKSQELEEDNRRMQEANRLKSEFLANMSHELRTPLNAIIGFAELMFRGKVGPISRDHKEYLGDILNSSRHLLQLINDVLDLAKVESGKLEFRPEALDLGKVVAEVRDILRGLASTKQIRVETKVDPSIAAAVLDPSKLKQVLYNYLSNALKFTPEEGQVAIHVVREDEDHVRIEIVDSGIGIRPEDNHRLFVEFQQLDAGMAKKYPGTGLGLALTKRIVEAQGGRVGVKSEPGKGSTFWAVLPRSAGGLQTLPTAVMPSIPLAAASGTSTILVVDDDSASLRLMDATLKLLGHPAACIERPADALVFLEKNIPAVVVLDVVMAGMDGFELLARMRAVPSMRSIPVIVWTVKDLTDDERRRLLESAQGIVSKRQGGTDAIVEAIKPYLAQAPPERKKHVR